LSARQAPNNGFLAEAALRAAIEKWAKQQPDKPKLSDAIRRAWSSSGLL
jgi:hypothetical protein